MTEESENKVGDQASNEKSTVGVPIAIVIAGALVAVAIYFGGSQAPKVPVGEEEQNVVVDEGVKVPDKLKVGEIREVSKEDHIRGASSAKVTIIEYSDLECPFCKRYHTTMKEIVKAYPNDVRWVYRHFPLEMLHSKAKKEAEAVECAGEQGKFWELVDLIFETSPGNDGLDHAKLPELAKKAGVVNASQFASCLESGKYAERIEADLADAQAAGGMGTPYSVIIGPDGKKQPLSGAQPFESVKAVIEEIL